ncbi:transposase [Chryseobacterium nematophagum]|uniref:Transposase n=1 Tax=Chryseobacterium nematophagum TaxID=2305228 RepID=A0A3M7TJK3_9FLAO|nr:transposase [Chryseobacterium nematophagum]RNA63284.1 transposase [Chryseobacterium nematophagum]
MIEKSFTFKNFHIGELIHLKVLESEIETSCICSFFNCEERELEKMYASKSLELDILLSWSKLLHYDFFRIYSQHLILYSRQATAGSKSSKNSIKSLEFRKNIYSKGIIDFILELIEEEKKTTKQIIEEYGIPSSTLHTWIKKYIQIKE